MSDKKGIVGLEPGQKSLEDRIVEKLHAVPKDTELLKTFVDKADRQGVRRRALIGATLDAIFEHGFPEEGASVEVERGCSVLSELAAARRDFLHDAERLKNGKKAERILRRVSPDTIDPEQQISASIKVLIIWFALLELWDRNGVPEYPTKEALIMEAAENTGRTAGSIKAQMSRFKNEKNPSDPEWQYFSQLLEAARQRSEESQGGHSAFELLLPAALALSKANKS
jgi:hypothetical protein